MSSLEPFFGFLAISFISHFDRLGIFVVYRLFGYKIHNNQIKNMVSGICLGMGAILIFFAFERALSTLGLLANIMGVSLLLGTIFLIRTVALKTDYTYFSLDDDFYIGKDGKDIRK